MPAGLAGCMPSIINFRFLGTLVEGLPVFRGAIRQGNNLESPAKLAHRLDTCTARVILGQSVMEIRIAWNAVFHANEWRRIPLISSATLGAPLPSYATNRDGFTQRICESGSEYGKHVARYPQIAIDVDMSEGEDAAVDIVQHGIKAG